MENVNILQVVTKVSPFVRAKNPQREADERPQMNGTVFAAKMMTDIMDLRMTVVTTSYAVVGSCLNYLVKFLFAIRSTFLSVS